MTIPAIGARKRNENKAERLAATKTTDPVEAFANSAATEIKGVTSPPLKPEPTDNNKKNNFAPNCCHEESAINS